MIAAASFGAVGVHERIARFIAAHMKHASPDRPVVQHVQVQIRRDSGGVPRPADAAA